MPGACEPILNASYSPSLGVLVGAGGGGVRSSHAHLVQSRFASFRTMVLLHDSYVT